MVLTDAQDDHTALRPSIGPLSRSLYSNRADGGGSDKRTPDDKEEGLHCIVPLKPCQR
jgi:hypothetical protein